MLIGAALKSHTSCGHLLSDSIDDESQFHHKKNIMKNKSPRWFLAAIFASLLVCATFSTIVFSKEKNHSLTILNRGSEDLLINKICIGNNLIASPHKTLKPLEPSDRVFMTKNRLDYQFKGGRRSELTIELSNSNINNKELKCQLLNPGGVDCVYYASINESNKLSCICDYHVGF